MAGIVGSGRRNQVAGFGKRETLVTGMLASTTYLVAMVADMKLTSNRYDDRIFWGGYLTAEPRRQKILGTIFIYVMGTLVATIYRTLLPILPRWPGWLLGAAFVEAENTLRWPMVLLMSSRHPAVRRGELPSLWTQRYFWVEASRHTIFGIFLGLLVRRR